ncbi:MAG: carboxypeptidase-like regulatory domain-containing protein [Tannerellaceae bacterium]|jgi:hypothetical protein|nr:carboxypeptidase-like regulatory domain-containing protein [Tannerellaceae bacterium]
MTVKTQRTIAIIISIFVLVILPFSLSSQTLISGKVLDSDTKEPIPNVAVYSDNNDKITVTGEDGGYSLYIDNAERIHFRHLAYERLSLPFDSLKASQIILLRPYTVELTEVVISPNFIMDLLHKAVQNLHSRFQIKTPQPYLLHVTETTTNGGDREAYALIESSILKINKQGEYNWKLDLLCLDKLRTINEEVFYINKLAIPNVGIVPTKMSTRWNNYIHEILNDGDESQIVIKISPKHLDKKNYRYFLFIINKQDTTLSEFIGQSYLASEQIVVYQSKLLDIELKALNHYHRLVYAQDNISGSYYINAYQHLGNIRVISKGNSHDMYFKITASLPDISSLNKENINKLRLRRPLEYLLFEADFPQTPGFWKSLVSN